MITCEINELDVISNFFKNMKLEPKNNKIQSNRKYLMNVVFFKLNYQYL